MAKIKIIADSTCDLSPELVKQYDIKIMPLSVIFGKENYKDSVDIDISTLFTICEQRGELPKTSAVNAGEFIEVFKEYRNQGYQIICFTISNFFSSCYQNACTAAEEVDKDNIKVVDSLNLSTGIGLLVLKAAKFINEGNNLEEVYNKVCALRPKVRSQFVVEKLDYLYKGGRCSATAKIFGTLLKMRPVITVREGKMDVGKKPIGKPIKGWNTVLDYLIEDEQNYKIDQDAIFVTHSGTKEGCQYLMDKVKEHQPNANVFETYAGCVVGSHCGPNTIGILYIIEDK